MTLAITNSLEPMHVYLVSLLAGLARPSDLVMRNGLIGDTISESKLMSAMGLSRTTMDTARIIGALFGAGLFSLFGLGIAYIIVSLFYAISFFLTLGVSGIKTNPSAISIKKQESIFFNLKQGLVYVWQTPALLAAMWLAFLVNLTVFPVSHGILPYVAKSVYEVDESGLSHLVAAYAFGALLGSITMVFVKLKKNPARFMIVNIFLMHVLIIIFAYIETKIGGQILLFFAGYIQSLAMISLVVTLLAIATGKFRGLVMGVRMMAVYGLPVGLMVSGYLIEQLGYSWSVMLYGIIGLLLSASVATKWRNQIWFER